MNACGDHRWQPRLASSIEKSNAQGVVGGNAQKPSVVADPVIQEDQIRRILVLSNANDAGGIAEADSESPMGITPDRLPCKRV